MRASLWLIAALACCAAVPPAAGAPPRVDNGAEPAQKRVDVTLRELWRAGGDDDEVFFGNIGTVLRGPDGKIYILDTQQSHVEVYAADGAHLATLGREGDGPGEVRRPTGMALLSDGRLCLLQGFPGRMVMLKPDGTPAGEATYQQSGVQSAGEGAFSVLNGGVGAPGGDLILLGIRMSFGNTALSDQTFFLSRCAAEGREKTVYLTKPYQINYADFRLDEGKMDFVWTRLAVDSDGRIYAAPERDAYLIRVFAPDGAVEREFTRAYSPRQRDGEQRKTATRILEAVGAYYPTPLLGTTVADAEPVIGGLNLDDEGNLLVAHGDQRDLPPGVFTVLDVFDRQGRFIRQLAIRCPGDARRDGLIMMSGGVAVMLRGALDAWLTQQAVATGAGEAADAPALEVICYSLR